MNSPPVSKLPFRQWGVKPTLFGATHVLSTLEYYAESPKYVLTKAPNAFASAAAGSGSDAGADAVRRHLHAFVGQGVAPTNTRNSCPCSLAPTS